MDIDTAKTVCVTQDWDTGIVLDIADELIGTARDDKVDVLVEFEEACYDVTGGEELYGSIGNEGISKSVGNGCGDSFER